MIEQRRLASPEKSGLYKRLGDRGERVVAWVSGPGMSYNQDFEYPWQMADALAWLEEHAPGIRPQITKSLIDQAE